MDKILTRKEFDLIQTEVHKIAEEIDWLDPSIPGEDARLGKHLARLEELEKILLTSLKNQRIKKSGLKVVQ